MTDKDRPTTQPPTTQPPTHEAGAGADVTAATDPSAAARPAWAEAHTTEDRAAERGAVPGVTEQVFFSGDEYTRPDTTGAGTYTAPAVTEVVARAEVPGHTAPSGGPALGRAASATTPPDTATPPLGRHDGPLSLDAAAVGTPVAGAPALSPRERLQRERQSSLGLRALGGLVMLGLIYLALTTPGQWTTGLFLWVLLTVLADEFGGWFGYAGALLGLLKLIGVAEPSPEWQAAVPMVGGALLALLLVKHSGGWWVLPFAAAAFVLPLYAISQYGDILDPTFIQVSDPDLLRNAVLGALIGLSVSLIRQVTLWAVDLGRRRAERRELREHAPVPREAVPPAAP